MYVMKSTREALLAQEKTIVTGDCCYLNPLVRRIVRFIGESALMSNTQKYQSINVHHQQLWVQIRVFTMGQGVW